MVFEISPLESILVYPSQCNVCSVVWWIDGSDSLRIDEKLWFDREGDPHCTALIPAFLAILFANVTSTQKAQSPIQHKPLPAYVLQLAPLSHLHSQEEWFPSDISVHLTHVVPQINFTNVSSSVTFQSIGRLSSEVFLTSKDPVEDEPEWMFSTENKPDEGGAGGKVGRSGAPATIICVEKAGGTILDVFYFYFYSFNEGSDVFGMPSLNQDDHVGDWEHSMVRFIDGAPTFIYLSSHTSGQAFNYSVLQPITNTTTSTNTTSNPSITSYANRAITYIARGTHANYAVPGNHPHGPMNALSDVTDAGPLWDITLNFRGYWFDNSTEMFSVAGGVGRGGREERSEGFQQRGAKSFEGQTKGFGEERVKQRGLEGGDEGVGWLEFLGKWGDQSYPVPEHGQVCFMGTCKFTDGPTGPITKNLGRTQVCEDESNCTILNTLQ